MRDKDWIHKEDVVAVCASTMGRDAIRPSQYKTHCLNCSAQIGPAHATLPEAQLWLWDNRRAQEEVFGRTLCDACIANRLRRLEGKT